VGYVALDRHDILIDVGDCGFSKNLCTSMGVLQPNCFPAWQHHRWRRPRRNMFYHFAFHLHYDEMTRSRDAIRLAELYDDLTYAGALRAIRQECDGNPDETLHQGAEARLKTDRRGRRMRPISAASPHRCSSPRVGRRTDRVTPPPDGLGVACRQSAVPPPRRR
jgi:hypothetical protein